MTSFILSGIRNGVRVYWTGRAGDGWVSANRAEAFPASQVLLATRRDHANQFAMLHGVTFDSIEGA